MKIFRYALVALGLTLMASRSRSQDLVAYDLSTATAGNFYTGQQNFGGTVGMEFDVNSAAIKVTSLGVFDSNRDGFQHVLTAYIFDRDTHNLLAQQSFSGTTTGSAGTLIGYHRFKDLTTGLILNAGHYIIAADAFTGSDTLGNETFSGFKSDTFNSGGGLITSIAPSVYAEAFLGPGTYPNNGFGSAFAFNAGSFTYSLYVPEPGSVALLFCMIGVGGSTVYQRVRRRNAKKRA